MICKRTFTQLLALFSIFSIQDVCAAHDFGFALLPNDVLRLGDTVTSFNARYSLIMQNDGSLVLYRNCDGKKVYGMGKHGDYAVMQADGNFVEYTSGGRWLWATHTDTTTGEKRMLRLTDDGELMVTSYAKVYTVYWSSGRDSNRYQCGNRYPMVVNDSLGAKPSVPVINDPPKSMTVPTE